MTDWVVLGTTAVGTLLGGGGIGVVLGRIVEFRKAGTERAKVDSDAEAKAKTDAVAAAVAEKAMLLDGMGKLITTLQTTLDTRTRGEDAARAAHGECMEEVQKATAMASEAVERVTVVETVQAETAASLKACEERDRESQGKHAEAERKATLAAQDAAAAAEQVRALRIKVSELDRRTTDPTIKKPG
jgi:hypothetical protein